MLKRRKWLAGDERGVVLVIVMGLLLTLGLIAATVLASALTTKSGTAKDRANKQAYGAALAGMRTAIYWLNTNAPADTACPPIPGTSTPVTPNSANVCGPYESDNQSGVAGATTQPLTNARYTYWITPVLSSSTDICTGSSPRIATNRKLTVADRCITAIGQAYQNGTTTITATRRIQARVSATQALFPIPGVWGTACVSIGTSVKAGDKGCDSAPSGVGSASYVGAIGSNGSSWPSNATGVGINAGFAGWLDDPNSSSTTPANLYLGNQSPTSSTLAGYDIKMGNQSYAGTSTGGNCNATGSGGSVEYCTGSSPNSLPYTNNSPIPFGRYFPLPRVGDMFSNPYQKGPVFATSVYPACATGGTPDVASCNDNTLLQTAVASQPCGTGAAATSYDSTKRVLVVGKGCTLNVPNGTYDLCSVTLQTTAAVRPSGTPASNDEIRFFIDSPNRVPTPSSAQCPGTTDGQFNIAQSGTPPSWMTTATNSTGNATSCPGAFTDTWTALAGQIYYYGGGDPADTTTNYPPIVNTTSFDVPGGMMFNGLVEAPNSTLNLVGSGICMKGGLAAGALNISPNAGFIWDSSVDSGGGTTIRTYYRTAWANCDSSTGSWTGTPAYPTYPMDGC